MLLLRLVDMLVRSVYFEFLLALEQIVVVLVRLLGCTVLLLVPESEVGLVVFVTIIEILVWHVPLRLCRDLILLLLSFIDHFPICSVNQHMESFVVCLREPVC
jgi:hypothetical protein